MIKYILLIIFLILPKVSPAQIHDWHLVKEPTKNKPQIYGSPYAGCLDGGKRLPDSAVGYVLRDVHENRAYGHPQMLSFIEKLGSKFHDDTGRTLIISDLSSPRGGPVPITSSLHQSHQSGLDVDIWFRNAKESENPYKIKQVSMLDGKWNRVNEKYWGNDKVAALKYAASFDEVDRIFVNPVIKNELCRHYAGEEWMRKIRPWWGHSAHFHVRLKCPAKNSECKTQEPIPEGTGCGVDLEWWFSNDSKDSFTKKEPRKYPVLPKQCERVFEAHD